MGAHERESPRPVEIDLKAVTDRRGLDRGIELMDDLAGRLSSATDLPGATVGGSQEHATIGGLPAAARIEDGRVEHDKRRRGTLRALDRDDARVRATGVGIRVADLQVHEGRLRDGFGRRAA